MFPEILEEIVLKLESMEDVISLGSSSTDLARIVGQERIWRVTLAKTELVEDGMVREDRVRTITNFLISLPDSHIVFSLLHNMIYERYPATWQGKEDNSMEEEESITVSFPCSPQLHSVSHLGLELLALTVREGARHVVHKVDMAEISPYLLLSMASHQLEQITELVVGDIECITEEEGQVLASLLERCTSWRVGGLELRCGGVGGQTWEGLARQVARGWLGWVWTSREVVARGRREDLGALWKITEGEWTVDEEWIRKRDGEVEGWGTIEKMIL